MEAFLSDWYRVEEVVEVVVALAAQADFVGEPRHSASTIAAMAFKSGRSLVKCPTCDTEAKFFKMFQSYRPQHSWTDEDGRTKATLFCLECEFKMRMEEWLSWNDEEKKIAGEGYATKQKIVK